MIKKFIVQVVLGLITAVAWSQPYSGTIFVDGDIITASDSSAFVSATYTGQGVKTIFDRRVNNWITVNAFLFDVVWKDGLVSEAVINPEFETEALAAIEAEKYGWSIGQLPYCLRLAVNEIWINKGVELFGGGNNSILIHTGQTMLYENDGILAETLVHEAAHTSLDAAHAESAGWLNAQTLDGGFISDYAEENPLREDIAESFLMWMAVRYRADQISTTDFDLITNAIPNRLNYFDEITCDLFPFEYEPISSLNDLNKEETRVVVFPNPTHDFIQLKFNEPGNYSTVLYNSLGAIMLSTDLETEQRIDIADFSKGLYYLVIEKEGEQIVKRILKF